MGSPDLKTSFDVHSKYEAFYTGGKVQLSEEGEHILCQCGSQVNILHVASGRVHTTIGQEEDDLITSFILSPDSEFVIVASRNLLLKQWNWRSNVCVRTWKAIHTGPVSCMSYDCTSTLLATGSSDSTIKVWDTVQKYCTHNLTGHQGVVSVVKFHPNIEKLQLFTAAEDYKIRIWDLRSSKVMSVLENHYSVITSLQFSLKSNTLYSAGRDNIVTVWNLHNNNKEKTIPVYESVEGMILLPEGRTFPKLNVDDSSHCFVIAGSKGALKIWNTATSHCVFTHKYDSVWNKDETKEDAEVCQAFVDVSYNEKLDTISLVTFDHNIIMCKAEDMEVKKQFVGYNDDILDIRYLGPSDSHVVVATNSELIKVFETETWDCQILRGHTDTVMCVDVFKPLHLMASGSKDNNLLIWQMNDDTRQVSCVAVARGHTHAVLSVAFPRKDVSFLVSASQDCTIKTWTMPSEYSEDVTILNSKFTERAHDKDVNAVCVSPNDKLIATGSMDKTAKLWTAPDLKLLGVFRGHKRGIWGVQFSPVDQVVATASADACIYIWSISDFSCVKTFEGHESSVLKTQFLNRGMQLVSSGSDGLLKIWTIKSNECSKTYDQHEDKVWALAVNSNEDRLVTGAGDSTIIIWKDVTEEEKFERDRVLMDTVSKEQKLANLMHNKKYLKAIGLAITLDQPFKVLNIIKEVLGEENGKEEMRKTICKLREDQLDAVLRYAVKWNMNSKHCHAAQYVLSTVLHSYTLDELNQLASIKSTIQALLPYTERHFQRMNRLQQATMFVDYTWLTMNPVAVERPTEEMNSGEVETGGGTFNTDRIGNSADESDEEEIEISKTDLSKRVKGGRTDEVSSSSSSSEESENESSEISDYEKNNTSDNSNKENGITHSKLDTTPVRPLSPDKKKNMSGKQKVKRKGRISVSLSKRRKHIESFGNK